MNTSTAGIQLSAQKRTLTGRKVKKLRQDGLIPANIYGKAVSSQAIAVSLLDLKKVYKEAGETQVIELALEKEAKTHPVMITDIQVDPINKHVLHVDFRQVDLTQKVNAMVPLEFIGKSPAEALGAVVITLRDEIEVEALPREIPEKLEIDLSKLKKSGDMITIADLNISKDKVTPILPETEILVKAEEPKAEEEEAPKVEEAAPAEAGEAKEGDTEDKGDAKEGAKPAASEKDAKPEAKDAAK